MSDLLLLTPQLPYPPHQGTSLRNFNIIRGLSGRNRITLLSYVEENQPSDPQTQSPLLGLCEHVVIVPAPRPRSTLQRLWQMITTRMPDMGLRLDSLRFEINLRRLLSERSYDVIQVEGIEMAWTMDAIRAVQPGIKILYDAHNAETVLQSRALQADINKIRRWPAAAYSWVQTGRLRRFEAWAGCEADWITAVSELDKANLADQMEVEQVPITVIPNCIDVSHYMHELPLSDVEAPSYDVVFVGKMDFRPNVDAVLWFADEVWPEIVTQMPNLTWAVVGQKPHARLARLRDLPGVTVTGWVDNVFPFLSGAKLLVMPFRVGSGTRLKLIEALAAGKAVVSTSLGVEGYPVIDGREVLLADKADDMVRAVLGLLADPERRERLGANGREFAQQYDWRKIIPRFDEIYEALLG